MFLNVSHILSTWPLPSTIGLLYSLKIVLASTWLKDRTKRGKNGTAPYQVYSTLVLNV